MALIKTIMKERLVTASPDTSIHEVIQLMNENKLGAILIVENNKLVGIFSERDLLNRVALPKIDMSTPVKQVSTLDPVSVHADTHIKECARLIKERRFRHLPVVGENNQPIGIISARDFFQYIVENLEAFIDRSDYKSELDQGHDPYDHMGAGHE